MATLYIHFPWCLAKCPYCDFVSYAAPRESIDHAGYADAVLREADARAEQLEHERRQDGTAHESKFAKPFTITSIFFGGGTPSLWEPSELGRVLRHLKKRFAVPAHPAAEVTVECNPTSLDEDRARALVNEGVDRLSIGTQSLRAEQLRFLGRLHDPDGARRAVESAKAAGVPRVSTDLIFGLPDQSVQDARDQALALADAGLRHLSCYQLTIEPGTQFGERKKRGLLPMADEGLVADAFLAIDEALESRGLRHYEISNYAEEGQEARHNLSYWRGEEYLGLGVAAYGFVRRTSRTDGAVRGVRYRNQVDPKRYVEASKTMRREAIGEGDGMTIFAEPLDGTALLRERIMLGLRVREGVDMRRAGRDLEIEPWTPERTTTVERLVDRRRLVREGDVLRIPKNAWLFADDTASRLF